MIKRSLLLILGGGILLAFGCSDRSDNAVRIIYSGGLVGYLEPCGCREGRVGGLARLAGAIQDSLRQWKTPAILLDAGEFAESYGSDLAAKNKTLLESLALMQYDAVNVTSRDLMAGLDNLQWAADSLHVPLISANLINRETRMRLFPGWAMKEIPGHRIGVIGVGAIRPLERIKAGAVSLEFVNPDSAIRGALAEIGGQCDLTILLCDLTSRVSRDLALRIPGLDLVISTSEIFAKEQARKFGTAYVVGTSRKGKHMTTMRLLESDSLQVVLSKTLLDSTTKVDPKIEKLIASRGK